MKSIQKYLKKKTADGTVSKVAGATLALFSLAYFISSILLLGAIQAGNRRKVDLNFLKDAIGSMTCFYIIASSVILAVLISSFIFHKVKAKRLNCNSDLLNKTKELLLSDSKKDKIEKVTISLGHNGLVIRPSKNEIEIPVVQDNTENKGLTEIDNKLFEGVTFTITQPFFGSSKNKSIYPEVIGSQRAYNIINEINGSKIFFFKKTDHDKYHNSDSYNVRYQYDTAYLSDEKTQKSADKIFKFTKLYNINSIKFHYADCSSTEVKLKLKEEPAADMELCEYINASISTMPAPALEKSKIAFIPAIAGNKPIFIGEVL
ncbi:hypothetical protein [Candidatus Mesenet endosymbiont of Phosphuga atrata]|uniref:hypothetical protein n=1 Tax=Candidatus Mesenet endosymbiont of Phosphuga atrata TaxID=3066221 RepID=UPI0030D59B95